MRYIHKIWINKENLSTYELENGYISYNTLAKEMGSVILNNNIMKEHYEDFEIENGSDYYYYDSETDEIIEPDEATDEQVDQLDQEYCEFFQYYIITARGARILEDNTNQTVWYSEKLDMYLWGISHFGTSWDYVLTDVKID